MADERYTRFEAFWPFYLEQHGRRATRWLHFAGLIAGAICLLAAALLAEPWLVPAAVVAGYGFAWVGHVLVERNRPATFRYPLYSLRGDFKLFAEMLRGRLR